MKILTVCYNKNNTCYCTAVCYSKCFTAFVRYSFMINIWVSTDESMEVELMLCYVHFQCMNAVE